MKPVYYYRRDREGIPTMWQTSPDRVDDPELVELTEDEYIAEIEKCRAALPDFEPGDAATEEDFLDALTELGVIG